MNGSIEPDRRTGGARWVPLSQVTDKWAVVSILKLA
jgi:hypothetical protein